jgi:hypothetical protein
MAQRNVQVCQLCKDTSKTVQLFCKQCHCPLSVISQNSRSTFWCYLDSSWDSFLAVKPVFTPVPIDTSPTNAFQFELEGLGFEENERTGQMQLERVLTTAIYPLLFDSRTRMLMISFYSFFVCFFFCFHFFRCFVPFSYLQPRNLSECF